MSNEDDYNYEEYGEEQVYFVNCNCPHEPGDHGWGRCDVDDCPCEGGWEE